MISMQEIRQKSDADLRALLADLAAQLRSHRFGTAIQQERNTAQRRLLRRTIARIKTELATRDN